MYSQPSTPCCEEIRLDAYMAFRILAPGLCSDAAAAAAIKQ
jgi:hypothetical protein